MRRVRTLVLLVALACAVLAGSTSVVAAGGPSLKSPTGPTASVLGKRW